MHPIAGIAGDREVYRQKFLNRAGDNSVSRTAPQRLSAGHPCVLQDGHTSLHANDSQRASKARSVRSLPAIAVGPDFWAGMLTIGWPRSPTNACLKSQ